MAELLDLEVVTPERQLVHEHVTEVQLPGKDGYMGILTGHAALLGALGIGFLTYVAAGRRRYLSVHAGFVEVFEDHVRVLADAAERAEEIDIERARTALRRAQEQVINPALGVDPAIALAALQRAQARLAVAEHKQEE
ncbi:MAG TPA: F0F1 ATP synthase subunit epsilon [Bryobacteraceae bacterium]|nr:F0F1 ATP synthase subunit epsilon [Bryobacteraceae bacterium]